MKIREMIVMHVAPPHGDEKAQGDRQKPQSNAKQLQVPTRQRAERRRRDDRDDGEDSEGQGLLTTQSRKTIRRKNNQATYGPNHP